MLTLKAGTEPALTPHKGLWPEEFRPTVPYIYPQLSRLLHLSSIYPAPKNTFLSKTLSEKIL